MHQSFFHPLNAFLNHKDTMTVLPATFKIYIYQGRYSCSPVHLEKKKFINRIDTKTIIDLFGHGNATSANIRR